MRRFNDVVPKWIRYVLGFLIATIWFPQFLVHTSVVYFFVQFADSTYDKNRLVFWALFLLTRAAFGLVWALFSITVFWIFEASWSEALNEKTRLNRIPFSTTYLIFLGAASIILVEIYLRVYTHLPPPYIL